jgi:hypothetical protein
VGNARVGTGVSPVQSRRDGRPQPSRIFSSPPVACCPSSQVSAPKHVTKIAIDNRARESENKRHEENLAGVLPATGRLRGKEAAGCRDPASHSEPAATTHCRTHRTLCSSPAGKCQHGDLQLSARDHRDRFKNRTHKNSLQENERRKVRTGAETGRQIPSSPGAGRTFLNGSEFRMGLRPTHWHENFVESARVRLWSVDGEGLFTLWIKRDRF